jgi:hypothetical protein
MLSKVFCFYLALGVAQAEDHVFVRPLKDGWSEYYDECTGEKWQCKKDVGTVYTVCRASKDPADTWINVPISDTQTAQLFPDFTWKAVDDKDEPCEPKVKPKAKQ